MADVVTVRVKAANSTNFVTSPPIQRSTAERVCEKLRHPTSDTSSTMTASTQRLGIDALQLLETLTRTIREDNEHTRLAVRSYVFRYVDGYDTGVDVLVVLELWGNVTLKLVAIPLVREAITGAFALLEYL